jgi:HK97 family phage major capsid protein
VKSKRLVALEARRDALKTALDAADELVIERAQALSDDELQTYEANEKELGEVAGDIKKIVDRENTITRSIELGDSLGSAVDKGKGRQGEGADEDGLIYREAERDSTPLLDIWRAQTQLDPDSIDRVRKHNEFMAKKIDILRASDRSDFGGLIVPEYATNEFAEHAREQRGFLNSLPSRPLTKGIIVIGRSVEGAEVGAHVENSPFAENDIETEPLTLTAKTIAGVAEVSIESVEFGTLEESVLFGDLIAAYAEKFDYQAFWGTGANGQHKGIFVPGQGYQRFSGATIDTFRDMYGACLQGAAQIRSVDKRIATHVVMSSARWYSLIAATDLDGRPLISMPMSAPVNVGGATSAGFAPITFAGLNVVVDDNIVDGGDDDRIVIYRAAEFVLREQNGGNPTTIRVDQAKASQGTVQFIARGFSIFSGERRPKSVVIIDDMPEPTFALSATDESGFSIIESS